MSQELPQTQVQQTGFMSNALCPKGPYGSVWQRLMFNLESSEPSMLPSPRQKIHEGMNERMSPPTQPLPPSV